jgi:hypothetical protein
MRGLMEDPEAMRARLTYFADGNQPMATFALDSPVTVVGRGPWEVHKMPAVVEKVRKREPFQVRLGDTLFIGIPSEMRLGRSHFAIRRVAGPSGEVAFFIWDLQSRCGFMVNDARNQGSAEVQLKDGDRIHYGFEFTFSLG